MSKIFTKFLDWLNKPRFIEISFGTLESEDEQIARELAAAKQQVMSQNYLSIMRERLIPFVRDYELTTNGLLMSDEQCFSMAHQLFCNAKRDGKLDELNQLVMSGSEIQD